MSSLSKSAMYTFLTQIPTQLFGIIAGVFITRMLGPEGRGLYAIFYADVSLFTTVLGFSINTAITHFKAKDVFAETKLLSVSLLFSLITVLLSLIIVFVWMNMPFADLLFPVESITSGYILLFIIFIILEQVNTVYSSLFQGARRFDVVNKVLFFNSIFNLVLFGSAFVLHQYGIIEAQIEFVLIIAGLVLFMNALQWHRHFGKTFVYSFNLRLKWESEIKPFFSFMGLGHLSNIINFLNYRLVLWVMVYYLDNGQIGVFALGAGLAQMLNFISNPLNQVLMPFLSAEKEVNRLSLFKRFARVHFTVILFLGIVAMFLAGPLIPLIYGVEFEESATIFYFIFFGVLLSSQSRYIASYFISEDKLLLNLLATLFGFLLTFGFSILLVKNFGINGAAIAQTITYTGIFLFVYIAMLRFTKHKLLNIFIVTRSDIDYVRKKFGKSTKKDRPT